MRAQGVQGAYHEEAVRCMIEQSPKICDVALTASNSPVHYVGDHRSQE